MFYLNQEPIAIVDNISVFAGKVEDFCDIWEMLKEKKEYFFDDFDNINNRKDFELFYAKMIYDICLARDEHGQIVYASWIIISGWKSFFYCVIAKKKYTKVNLSKKLHDIVINYYKTKYKPNRFDALVNASNRLSRIIILKMGFTLLGRIPKYTRINNKEVDYYKYFLEV